MLNANPTPLKRKVYVDKFNSGNSASPYEMILGDSVKEDALIQWAVDENIGWLLLYDLNSIRSGSAYTSLGKTKLRAFIAKCTLRGIKVGASHSGSAATVAAVLDYNNTSAVNERFDEYVVEDEFWNPGGDFAVTTSNAANAKPLLNAANIFFTIYTGFFDQGQANILVTLFDAIYTHDYRLNPQWSYCRTRWTYLGTAVSSPYPVYPIFSVESTTNNGPGVVDTQFNFCGYELAGLDASGNPMGTPKSIDSMYNEFALAGTWGSPLDYQSESNTAIRNNCLVGGYVIFAQSLLRTTNYLANPTSGSNNPPIITAGGSTTICPGGSVTLFSDQTTGNVWSTGETTNSIVVTQPGNYYVTANSLQSNVITVAVTVIQNPTPSISGITTPSTQTSPLTFTASIGNTQSGMTIRWEINGIDQNVSTLQLTRVFNNGDVIRCFAKNPGPCNQEVASNSLTISFPSGPVAPTITPGPLVTIGSSGFVILTSSYPGGNIWSTGEIGNSIIVTTPGTYTVRAIDSFGQYSAESSPVEVVLPEVTIVDPLPRIGADASAEVEGSYPEFISGIVLEKDDPYSIGRVINYPYSLSTLNRMPLSYVADKTDKYVVVDEATTLWGLAFKEYGNSKLYWVIQDVNKLENSFELPIGKTLLIPNLQRAFSDNTWES